MYKRQAPKCDGIKLSCIQFLTAGIIGIVCMLIFESPVIADILDCWLPILYCGVFSSGIAYTLQAVSYTHLDVYKRQWHINMIPYDSALEHTGIYDKIEIAITPAEAHLVPVQIKEIIDIGYRKVSFDTMFKLMKMLDLDIGIINRNLFRHIHSVVESNTAFHANYVYGLSLIHIWSAPFQSS